MPTSPLAPIWVIAKNSYKEIVRDKLLYGILIIALLVTASSFFLATVSLGQDSRVLQNVGLASIHIFTAFICIFVATNSIQHDFDRRTLYLLFPKPISRAHYILGKFLGLVLLLLTTLAILGGLFSLGVAFTDHTLLLGNLMNFAYSFLEVNLLIALAIFFTTFTAPLNAALYTLALFIIGHSLGSLKDYAVRLASPFVAAIIKGAYYLLPNLEKFDIRQATLYRIHIAPSQVLWSLLYWLVYTVLVLTVAIQIIKKQEV